MRKHSLITFILFLSILALITPMSAQTGLPPGVVSDFQPQKSGDRVEQAYADGKKAIYEGNWQQAVDSYSQVVKAGGAHTDEALYWQAYAQNKLEQPGGALDNIARLRREYPRSQWLKDASALELEIRQKQGHTPNPNLEGDCDLKLLAVNSLLNNDPERAVPILEKLLNNSGNSGQCGGKILEKALFVLSQSGSSEARDLMMQIATGKLHPELQMKAINYIGIAGHIDDLMKVYQESNSADARRAALHGMGIGGGCKQLLAVSGQEKNPDLVREAIRSMGIAGCRDQVRDLYNKATLPELKHDILHSTIVSGDTELQQKIALNDPDPNIRAEAVKDMGISGGCKQLSALSGNEKDPQVISAAIKAMGIGGCREQLRDLYAKTTQADLKEEILHSTIVSGDTELQEKIALTDPDPNMRARAIKDLGISGGSSATLVKIYQDNQNEDVRSSVVNALFIKGDAHSLVELARKETNPDMRKQIVGKLSVMGSKEANDYLMEILNK